jgi:CDP-diacylglycerol--glycerol-3-phosphate 3-phosphatidyltransferase
MKCEFSVKNLFPPMSLNKLFWQANGFYGSKGISGAIPRAYSLLEQSLYERAQLKNVQQRSQVFDASSTNGLSIYEYERKGWTFHAKGFWCSLPGEEEGPNVTLIGSSNFGYRSRDHDLEAQLWIFSKAPHLRQQLERERDDLYVHSRRVNANVFVGDDRKGGLLASLAVRAVRTWL